MKILKISGKNLASLAGEFCVDFESEPLASSGLFAISGPTGAGKSTLLDALCLALYDATPRLGKRGGALLPDASGDAVAALDPRTLLRRGAAEAWAEVDFVGNDGQRYRARWSVRRSYGKASGALQAAKMSLHRLPELIALGGTKTEVAAEIVQRIGLTFEQFTRAVLLAQNEFSAFLKTDENERGELLETLTGSTVYSEISMRAWERYRAEQARTQALTAQLAHQAPLPAEERAALDTERAGADLALEALDARKNALEHELRWHQEADKLRRNEAQAEDALAAARAEAELAGERRRRLATLDAVQPARPLLAEVARVDAELKQTEAALAKAQAGAAAALEAQREAAREVDAAHVRLEAAEGALAEATPRLDQAKALDAALDALTPAQALAASALGTARAEADQARAAHQARAADLESTRRTHQAAAAWLAAHARLETLATQWPRWDKLLLQAEGAAKGEAAATASLDQARQALDQASARDAHAAGALAAAAERVRNLESGRQQAIAALAGFDTDALRAQRQALDLQRERLAAADKAWTALAAARARLDDCTRQAAEREAALVASQRALDQAAADAPALAAAAAQAERSLKTAELACADSVEALRASLVDGQACPVCGSIDHPYSHQDARLQAMLAGLREQVDACRAQVQANQAAQAARRAELAALGAQLTALARERDTLERGVATLAEAWDADPLAPQAPAAALRAEWFAAELRSVKTAAAALDEREQAARQAAAARDAAQQRCDQVQAEHALLQEQAQAARATLAALEADLRDLAARRDGACANLETVLADLDPVLAQACNDAWRQAWQRDPGAWRGARAAEAAQWNEQAALRTRCDAAIGTLEAELAGAAARASQAERIAAQAQAEFARIDADIQARRRERAALLDGRPVREVERALAASLAGAREALTARQGAAAQAAQLETRERTACAQLGERIEALESAGNAAAAALSEWLDEYGRNRGELDPVADAGELAQLLGVGSAWLAQERAALNALEAQAASAATVLAERRAQRELHREKAPAEARAAEEVAAAFDALVAERGAAHERATALRLRVAQDEARREQAQAVLAEIERQQAVEQRWARLSELIGSSDGKKFRNYAQQFTLDVLLGYANAHLSQLARRYRLERVAHAGAPSLALMVRDQDMGGEVRSVNSLSGGESFLVSLALALGLASLSSNRVRVESLFIDEGFGSLDSETLGVAMDALDALQSLGRKVGVISHVQEMTERIATKVLVRPAGGGSSAVSVM